jgi:hypothetical protein
VNNFQKDGPKRRRHTRRELPEGGYSQWPKGIIHNYRVELVRKYMKRHPSRASVRAARREDWDPYSRAIDELRHDGVRLPE